ncbi:MAG: ATP-dependent DNA helicase RecG [Armatimonadota bacterium]
MGLQDSVNVIKGIGPKSVRLLAKLDVHTVDDLLRMFPRRFEDRTQTSMLENCLDGEAAYVTGTAISITESRTRTGLTLTKLVFRDDAGDEGEAVWFKPVSRAQQARMNGMRITLFGKVKRAFGKVSLQNPDIHVFAPGSGSDSPDLGLVPVYGLTDGLSQANLREWAEMALSAYAPTMVDPLPGNLRAKHRLPHVMTALKDMHFPASERLHEAARRRYAYEELLILHGVLQSRRLRLADKSAPVIRISQSMFSAFKADLPYTLTSGQEAVIKEIIEGLALSAGMLRLLQGDVGCGKTVVAAAGLLATLASGYQGTFLAPTELLARQQLDVLRRLLEPHGYRVEFLSGSVAEKQRRPILDQLAAGEPMVIVATHAILEASVKLPRLALSVIDEQHRFGVGQRNALMTKPQNGICHMLLMSATPIPRTMTQVTVGDVDVSTITSLPSGRKPIRTHVRGQEQRAKVYEGVRKVISDGGQAYVVCPSISPDGNDAPESVLGLLKDLSQGWLRNVKLGMVHGQLREDERTQVMDAFRRGDIDVLLATTVIEVGVDVPRANAIVIEAADQFGLAQLHQLRGRVGRGEQQSFCVLITSASPSDIGLQRLNVMASTTDGFVIAMEDLQLRGPGDVIGIRQSGVPQLRVTNLATDADLSQEAADDIRDVLCNPDLAEYRPVVRQIEEYIDSVDLGAVA